MNSSLHTFPGSCSVAGPRRGFTLLEIMVVVGIMSIVLTMGVPLVYKVWHKEPMRKTVSDIVEVCANARARAIMRGQKTEVVFHPRERRFEVAGAGQATSGETAPVNASAAASSGSGLAGVFYEEIQLEMLDVNLSEFREADEARVVFYPNGTADELTIVLRGPKNEWRKIWTEVTTGLVDWSTDITK